MPELPEVESVRRSLEPQVVGLKIHGIEVFETRLRYPVKPQKLKNRLLKKSIQKIHRRSKYLILDLEDGQHLMVHLGMSGVFYLSESTQTREKHLHIILKIGENKELRFTDPRRFGMFEALSSAELKRDKRLLNLGPEPLSEELERDYLFQLSRGVRKPVKNFIMDSRKLVGVGNIYACEALFQAGIHPQRAAGRISAQSWDRLFTAIQSILHQAIQNGGTTVSDFKNGNHEIGNFQNRLQVYQRTGESCNRCQKTIRQKVLAGRSSYYCPGCQK